MAAQRQTLRQLYEANKSRLKVDTINETLGRHRATPFSMDDSLEIDTSVVNDAFLQRMRNGIIDTTEYSSTVNKNEA